MTSCVVGSSINMHVGSLLWLMHSGRLHQFLSVLAIPISKPHALAIVPSYGTLE